MTELICKKPFVQGLAAYGCGQCLACRLNRRRQWTARIVLESLLRKDNCFLTLTYRAENLTRLAGAPGLATLVPEDLTLWLKRFRKKISPLSVRYFAVGEYGDRNGQPHYHVAVFGWPSCVYGISRYSVGFANCCVACDTVRDTWGLGFVDSRPLVPESAAYIAGYVVKKLTRKDDERLEGRHPEFARMSRMPGVGAGFVPAIGAAEMSVPESSSREDVTGGIRIGRSIYPLGRYMKGKLREACGVKPERLYLDAEMLDVFLSTRNGSGLSYSKALASRAEGKMAQMEWKSANLNRRKI